RVRPQAESILHDPPIQRKAPFGAFFASAAPSATFVLSRFNTAPIVITLFSERLYALVRPFSAVRCVTNICVF
ncbi:MULTISPECIES: hypothetical protein, partial [Serratia]|uniref:hypothetical protein n=1 Tax=Serratia TaxID=613 RepID=UPI001C2CEE8C